MTDSKSKIVIIFRKYPYGGAERQGNELLAGLINNDLEVDLVSIEGELSYKVDNINIIGLNKKLTGLSISPLKIIDNIRLYYNLYKIISGKYDVVITFVQLYLLGLIFNTSNFLPFL